VLWFPAPPVDMAPAVPKLRHSFAYMHYLTKKRKMEIDTDANDVMDVDRSENGEVTSQKRRMTASEILDKAIAEVS
jgi:hypothetical protein